MVTGMLRNNTKDKKNDFGWPENYYLETDAKKRKELLNTQLESDPTEENQLRQRLWEKRYTLPGKGMTGADYFMRVVLTMELVAEKSKSLFGKKTFREGIQEIRDVFCLNLLKENPDYSYVWKEEFVNFWSLYIEACKGDKNYTGLFMGLGHMSDENLRNKLKNDIGHKAVELPEKLGLSQELTPFREAGREAFSYYFE